MLVWPLASRFFVLVSIVLGRISGDNNEEEIKFVSEFLFWLVNISSCEVHISIAVEDCTVRPENHL